MISLGCRAGGQPPPIRCGLLPGDPAYLSTPSCVSLYMPSLSVAGGAGDNALGVSALRDGAADAMGVAGRLRNVVDSSLCMRCSG
jgi:hypothetical protein